MMMSWPRLSHLPPQRVLAAPSTVQFDCGVHLDYLC